MTFIIYGRCTTYSEDGDSINNYNLWQNIHVMIFVGYGFLVTYLRKYGWGAVAFTYCFAIVAAQWDILLLGFFHQAWNTGVLLENWKRIEINIYSLISADFCAAAVMISFGAVIGKISHMQLLVVTLMECIFYAINEMLVYLAFGAVDAGGTFIIHAFGTYFGLSLSIVIGQKCKGVKQPETSHKNALFAMVGTVFLWMYWPSFNAGALANPEDQVRAIVNTLLSIGSSTLAVFTFSHLLRGQKFDMEDIQNATLAGGVAMGAAASMRVDPFGALLTGFSAGMVSVFGFVYLSPLLQRIGIDDYRGTHNVHGLPAIIGATASAIAAGCATSNIYGGDMALAQVFPYRQACTDFYKEELIPASFESGLSWLGGFQCGRTGGVQAGFQVAALALSIGLGLFGGAFTGAVVRLLPLDPLQPEECFEDKVAWNIEDGDLHELEVSLGIKSADGSD